MSGNCGVVFLVGAGTGDPGLITVRGRRLLEQADVVAHDRLVSRDLLAYARADAEIIDVRKVCGHERLAQEKINAVLIDRAGRGNTVVRLKGGDPFVFGRGWEEWLACRHAAVPCIVVPGVSSAIAVPASVGIPTTHRGTGRTFAVVAAHGSTRDDAAGLNYEALAKINTVVILMGRSNLAQVARSLISAGRDPDTPAACIERGTTPHQRSVVATLGTIAETADREVLRAPVVTVVGEVARCADEYNEYLDSLSVRSIEHREPLAGKRIVITRSTSSSHDLRERLSGAGAITIEAPMIRVKFPPKPEALDAAIRNLNRYDWIAFASVHGVRGFFRRLTVLDRDARALAPCKMAAIGPITARALRKRGINPDLAAQPYSAITLAEGMLNEIGVRPSRVLCPLGDIAGSELSRRLRRADIAVDEVVTYRTVGLAPPDSVLQDVDNGVHAVLFCSPRAARRFAQLRLDIAGATVACIGPSTASAARGAGMAVDVIAKEQTDEGLVAALTHHFGSAGGSACTHFARRQPRRVRKSPRKRSRATSQRSHVCQPASDRLKVDQGFKGLPGEK